MLSKRARYLFLTSLIIILSGALVGCGTVSNTPTPEAGTYSIDPVFREFYHSLGGQSVLGPSISGLFSYNNSQCQYTANVLMCFDPLKNDNERITLFSIGDALGIQDEPDFTPTNGMAVDGYQIYEEFQPLYKRLYGALYVGKPLTQPRVNTLKNRIEQYFQNVGFYRYIDDPAGEVHLLAYGVFACDIQCAYIPSTSSLIAKNPDNIDQPFVSSIARLGGLSVFGTPLSNPYLAPDGNLEQVFENVVLYSPPDNRSNVRARNLSQILGMPGAAPGPKVHGEESGVIFYPVEGELGYHVPKIFDEFIAQHGGLEISGRPLSDIHQIGDTLYQQCFQNYCLLYDSSAEASLRIRMAPLGAEYLKLVQPAQEESVQFTFSPETIILAAHSVSPRIKNDQEQIIEISVLRTQDQQPLANIESDLTLLLPDGSESKFHLPPTNEAGKSNVKISPLNPLPANGSVIAYRICLNVPSDQPICSMDSYLIWNFD